MHAALVISSETYADQGISRMKYAEADGVALGQAIEASGFALPNGEALVGQRATKTIVESTIRRISASLQQEDTLLVYYAGHAFSHGGWNYLTCHDTIGSDLAETSIRLQWLFEQLANSQCGEVILLLDACTSGLRDSVAVQEPIDDLAEDEIRDFFDDGRRSVCFTSCKVGETSWPNNQTQHAVWAQHVVEAFLGDAPGALKNGRWLTAASLQSHLKRSVPKTLRLTYADNRTQTPCVYGQCADDFILADLGDVLAERKRGNDPNMRQVADIAFIRRQYGQVRSLSGFKRTHRMPEKADARAERFIAGIATEELEQDVDAMRDALRHGFRFKRKEIDVSLPGDGTATIITPYFNYSASVSLDEEDASQVLWLRQVDAIKQPEQVFTDAFASVFSRLFDTVEYIPPTPIDLEDLIDRIEDMEDDRITLDYDRDATWCELTIEGIEGSINVGAGAFSIVQRRPCPPKQLLEPFFKMQAALADGFDLRSIGFDS